MPAIAALLVAMLLLWLGVNLVKSPSYFFTISFIGLTNGIIGNFTINSTGDINLTPITIYKQAGKKLIPQKTLIPSANLVGGP